MYTTCFIKVNAEDKDDAVSTALDWFYSNDCWNSEPECIGVLDLKTDCLIRDDTNPLSKYAKKHQEIIINATTKERLEKWLQKQIPSPTKIKKEVQTIHERLKAIMAEYDAAIDLLHVRPDPLIREATYLEELQDCYRQAESCYSYGKIDLGNGDQNFMAFDYDKTKYPHLCMGYTDNLECKPTHVVIIVACSATEGY